VLADCQSQYTPTILAIIVVLRLLGHVCVSIHECYRNHAKIVSFEMVEKPRRGIELAS